jgi:hypothetical protein
MTRCYTGATLISVVLVFASFGGARAVTPPLETVQVPVGPITQRDIEQLPVHPTQATGVGRNVSSRLELAVLNEINSARTDPQAYAQGLRLYETHYRGKLVNEPGHSVAMTIEGVTAVDDAISYLGRRQPAPPLQWSDNLASAANRLVSDLGPKGGLGHAGSDGSTMTQRIRAAGVWAGAMDEDISLVPRTAHDVVRQLVIDDGVPTRGHRTAIFDPGLSIAGVACGPHAAYAWMCVVDFAGALMAAPGAERGPPTGTPPKKRNPFGAPMPGSTVHKDGSWTTTFYDGAKTTYFMDGLTLTVFPKPAQAPPPPPNSPPSLPPPPRDASVNPDGTWTVTSNDGATTTVRPDGVAVPTPSVPPPPPITDEAMFKGLNTYIGEHPIEDATNTERGVSAEGGKARSGTVSYFSHGAEIYRATFDAQGKVVSAGKTAEGRALETMKRFNFAYFSGEHGLTAASIGMTPAGGDYFRHVSFTDADGHYRGFMDFDQDGGLTRGVVYKESGDVEAKWAGPSEPAPGPAPPTKLQDLDELNADLDREDAEQKAASLKAWREEYPPMPPQVSP